SGYARRVLGICRRIVEMVQARRRTARTEDVKAVIKEMQNNPTAAYLRELSFHVRLTSAALVKCVRRLGVEDQVSRRELPCSRYVPDWCVSL
ncbi:hypothetical protein C2E23DRAFT_849628, partial [Lenzites betulinus]